MNKNEKMQEIMNDFIPTLICSTEEIEKYCGKLRQVYGYSFLNNLIATYSFYMKYKRYPEMFATYKKWQELGRQVQKGEKASPMRRPITITKEFEDEETGEIEKIQRTVFKWFSVFDISQTNGEAIVQDNLVTGEIKLKSESLIEHLQNKGYKLEKTKTILQRGNTDTNGFIRYSENLSENDRICTLIHEYAHNLLGHFESNEKPQAFELEAESVSYMVTTYLGLKNEKARLYINNWGGTPNDLEKRQLKIIGVANKIIEEIKNL